MNRFPDKRKQIGNYGEKLAQREYQKLGFRVIAEQFRCPVGEIDLIVAKDNLLIFVEVRTRTTANYGQAVESITPAKINRIRRVSQYYLAKNVEKSQNVDRGQIIQYDVVTIYIDKRDKKAWLTRIPNAF